MTDLREPRVLHLTAGPDAINRWRSWWPCNALRTHAGMKADHAKFEDLRGLYGDVQNHVYDIIVTPRYVWAAPFMADAWAYGLRHYGVKWVMDLDDNLLDPEVIDQQLLAIEAQGMGPMSGTWRERLEFERGERIRLLRMVDAVTVENDNLGDVVGKYTDAPVYVLPNSIDLEDFQRPMHVKSQVGWPTIGWAGGARHERDLAPIARAWTIIAAEYLNLEFVVVGHQSQLLVNSVPSNRLTTQPWQALGTYERALQMIDIGCCSVANTPWNLCKSRIKAWEMTAAGAACVVSDVLYGNALGNHPDAAVVFTGEPEEWAAYLRTFIDSPDERRYAFERAAATVLARHNMARNWPAWRAAYRSILDIQWAQP